MSATTPRTFEGRPLAKPNEDVEDQGLAFDLQTISHRLSRRGFLSMLGIGAGGAALAACGAGGPSSTATSAGLASTSAAAATTSSTSLAGVALVETPAETNGPYPGDGSNGPDVLEEVGVERSDIRSSIGGGATASGVPMTIKINVIDITGGGNTPIANAAVYIWHCDAAGLYSMYSEGVENETYLRGVQVAGADGSVQFTTIVPGCYEGRFPHIHFEVFPDVFSITDAANNVLTSQILIPNEVCDAVYQTTNYASSTGPYSRVSMETDNIFSDSYEQQTPTYTGSVASSYTLEIDVAIDTATAQEVTMGGGPGGPGGQPPSGGPGERPNGRPPAPPSN